MESSVKTGTRGKPSLRQHSSGNWFYRVNGKNRYLGKDLSVAQNLYNSEVLIPLLTQTHTPLPTPFSSPQNASPQNPSLNANSNHLPSPTLSNAFSMLFESMPQTPGVRKWKMETANLLKMLGNRKVETLTVADLKRYRDSLKGFCTYSLNSRMYILRRLFKFLEESGHAIPKLPSHILKGEKVGELPNKAIDKDKLREIYKSLKIANPQLALCVRLQFLLALRPWSLPLILNGEGTWETPNVFVLDSSKTDKATGRKQRVVFSQAALSCLKKISIRFSNGQMYRQSCIRIVVDFTPHHLRHTAATELAKANVEDSLIETALGHARPLVVRTYRQPNYEAVAKAMQVLAKILPE